MNAYVELLTARQFDDWAELWHPEGQIILSYPPAGLPNTMNGRDTIVTIFCGLAEYVEQIEFSEVAVYQTTHPLIIFATFRLQMVTLTGHYYQNHTVNKIELKAGKIFRLVEYTHPTAYPDFLPIMDMPADFTTGPASSLPASTVPTGYRPDGHL